MLARRSFFRRCAFLAAGLVASRYMPLVDLVLPKPKGGIYVQWKSLVYTEGNKALTEEGLNKVFFYAFSQEQLT